LTRISTPIRNSSDLLLWFVMQYMAHHVLAWHGVRSSDGITKVSLLHNDNDSIKLKISFNNTIDEKIDLFNMFNY